MAQLLIVLNRCVNNKDGICCPYAGKARTRGAGYAEDYLCKLTPEKNSEHGYRITSGYVEWDRDINPVPNWCPIMTIEEKTLRILES